MFQLYRGENKLNFPWDDDEVRFVLDQHRSMTHSSKNVIPFVLTQ